MEERKLPCLQMLAATPDILRGLMCELSDEDLYREADPEEAFADFEDQRENNLEYLGVLPKGAASRVARHQAAGEITLGQMLHEWALHDLGHIRQVAELVRARRYLAGAGRLGEEYRLAP